VTLTGVTCPECHQGKILERRGRFGPFYGCSRYPDCTKNFRARPVPKPCPKCGNAYLLVRERKGGSFYVCEAEGCDYDASAGDLQQSPLAPEVPEEGRKAALVPATTKVAAKKTPRRRKEPVEAAAATATAPAPVRAAAKTKPKAKAAVKASAKAAPK